MTDPKQPLEYRSIADDFAVSGQILPAQVTEIAALGFKAIACNRPDHEAPDQPTADMIAAAATDAGVAFFNIPVSPIGMTYENVDATKVMLAQVDGPIFAYCRSGARSTNLWQFVQDQADG
ncbi:MAG: TIGR01244 family sulfur transferase [Pseudomonadota bacterium]